MPRPSPLFREAGSRISDRIRAASASSRPPSPAESRQPSPVTHDNTRSYSYHPTFTTGGSASSMPAMNSGNPSALSAKLLLAQQQQSAQPSLEEKKRRYQAKIARINKYRVPRKYARVVEKTLAVYNDDSTSLYDVLGIRISASEDEIKRAYRSLAFALHPGIHTTLSITLSTILNSTCNSLPTFTKHSLTLNQTATHTQIASWLSTAS